MVECPICNRKFKSESGRNRHASIKHNISSRQMYINEQLNGKEPKCKCGCGKPVEYKSWTEGFNLFYNYEHRSQYKKEKNTEIRTCLNKKCDNTFEVKKSNPKKYCSRQCSGGSKKVKENRRQTVKENWGVNHISKSEKIQEKIKKSNLEKFGECSYLATKKSRKKLKENKEKRIEKIKETNIKKYGVEYPFQSDKIQERIKISKNKSFFNRLFNSDRLKNKVKPLFNFNDFEGTKNKKYLFKCLNCNNKFKDYLRDGKVPRCKNCYPSNNTSLIEKEIGEYINSLDISIKENVNIFENNNLELDIYIPFQQIAIELNGLYWHSEIGGDKDKYYHLNKTKECEKKDIQLIHIFEDEWINKFDIVKHRLKHILGISNKSIYARKCNIKQINSKQKNEFLNLYHIQGKDSSKIKYGLFFEGDLVSVMTFSTPRVSLGYNNNIKNIWEISRFCSSRHVIGGASRLFTHFKRDYEPKEVYSYADKRWGDGNVYKKLGFDKIDVTDPNYWYIPKNGGQRFHRYNFAKHKLKNKLEMFDPDLTEWENMQLNGYDRIWDCGHNKYEWKK